MSALASAQADLVTSLFEKGDKDGRCVMRGQGVCAWFAGCETLCAWWLSASPPPLSCVSSLR